MACIWTTQRAVANGLSQVCSISQRWGLMAGSEVTLSVSSKREYLVFPFFSLFLTLHEVNRPPML